MNRTREGYKFYFNANTMEYAWERPKDVKKDYSILTREEIQVRQKSFKSYILFLVVLVIENVLVQTIQIQCSIIG